jgi:hypothetical protein
MRLRILTIIFTFFLFKISFSQSDSKQNGLVDNNYSYSEKIDLNKTINPRPDLANKSEIEIREKQLIPLSMIITNADIDNILTDSEKEVKKTHELLNQVVNPQASQEIEKK